MISPTVTELFNAACKPPYHTTKPIAMEGKISATGKNIELYQTVFTQAFLCFSFIPLKFSYSIFSLTNN